MLLQKGLFSNLLFFHVLNIRIAKSMILALKWEKKKSSKRPDLKNVVGLV